MFERLGDSGGGLAFHDLEALVAVLAGEELGGARAKV
jgi:hypothetical protein